MQTLSVQCCIAGGGPAGMLLGFLLARAGVSVAVLERHTDFFRDFRGDTIHPSTLEIMYELGLLDGLLALPHQEVRELGASIGGQFMKIADFTHLPTHCKFLAFMPQWDFLNFLAAQAKRYPSFDLRMEANVHDLLWADGRVTGVRASQPNDELEVRADLVVGADGRHSIVREKAGLVVDDFGVPMDVLWFRISRRPDDPRQALGWLNHGKLLIMIDRTDYFQCGYTIRKGTYEQIKQRGVDAFRADIASLAPFLRERLSEVPDWDQISLLSVVVNIAREWFRPGLLCIGDAAHAMSPIGGVGINLATQDAVATANILARPLRASAASVGLLAQVQRRRQFPTRVTQRAQVFIQDQLLNRILGVDKPMAPPWPLRLLNRWPLLRRLPAQLVGIGVRPEHVKSP
jgi:2-polyprenyl-6-methoxyphenol hydroxylase-like FAD-dependent oxidoreductase